MPADTVGRDELAEDLRQKGEFQVENFKELPVLIVEKESVWRIGCSSGIA